MKEIRGKWILTGREHEDAPAVVVLLAHCVSTVVGDCPVLSLAKEVVEGELAPVTRL